MNYKPGDKVKIKSIDLIYTDDRGSGYIMKEPHIQWRFTDGMIEDLVNTKPQEKMISLNDACEWIEKNFKSDGCFSLYYLGGGIYTPKNIAKDFRKAMEK